jgi:tetratricopeptide (TPR) repeat protein
MAPEPTPLVHNVRTAIERAERARERGCLGEAIDLLEQAVALEPANVEARTLAADAYARTRRVERAFAHLDAALTADPHAFRPRCALGELYVRLGIPAQARPHLAAALARATTASERARVRALMRGERAAEPRRPSSARRLRLVRRP